MDEVIMFINMHYLNGSDFDTPFWKMASESETRICSTQTISGITYTDFNPQFRKNV